LFPSTDDAIRKRHSNQIYLSRFANSSLTVYRRRRRRHQQKLLFYDTTRMLECKMIAFCV